MRAKLESVNMNTPPNEVPIKLRNTFRNLRDWTLRWADRVKGSPDEVALRQEAVEADALVRQLDAAVRAANPPTGAKPTTPPPGMTSPGLSPAEQKRLDELRQKKAREQGRP